MRAKYVFENIYFKRGLDPKVAMGIGDPESRARNFLQPYIRILKELKKTDFKNIKNIKFINRDWQGHLIRDYNEFYIEFEYDGSYISIGLNPDNYLCLENKILSKEEIKELIISVL